MTESKAKLILEGEDRTAAAIRSAKRGLEGLDQQVDKLSTGWGGLNDITAGSVGLGSTAAGLIIWGKAVLDGADALDDMRERSGVAVETLAGLEHVLRLNGGSLEDMGGALKKFNVALSDASAGDKAKTALFDALGVKSRDAESALVELADAFPRLSVADRQRVSMDLFGRSGDAMGVALSKGSEYMREMIDEGKRLNPVTAELAARAGDFNDNLDRLAQGFKSSLIPAIEAVLPKLSEFQSQMLAAQKSGISFWDSVFDLGTDNPFKTAQEQIAALDQQLERSRASRLKFLQTIDSDGAGMPTREQADIAVRLARNNLATLDEELAKLERKRNYYAEIAKQQERAQLGGKSQQEVDSDINTMLAGGSTEAKPSISLKGVASATSGAISDYDRWRVKIGQTNTDLEMQRSLIDATNGATNTLTQSQRQLNELNAGLEAGTIKMSQAEAERTRAALQSNAAIELQNESTKKAVALLAEQDATYQGMLAAAAEAEAQREREWQALLSGGPKAREQERIDQIERLNAALASGQIDAEKYSDALHGVLGVDPAKGADTPVDGMQEMIAQMRTASDSSALFAESIRGGFDDAAGAINDFVWGADASFGDLAESFAKTVTEMLIKKALLGAAFGSDGSGGLYGMGASFVSGLFSSGTAHDGGIAGVSYTGSKMVSPAVFAGAPRYHSGGLVGGEVPIIAKRGEGVFTPEQMRNLSPADSTRPYVTVQVIEDSSKAGTTEQSQGSNGEELRVFVDSIKKSIAGDISSGSGVVSRAMENTYALSRANQARY